MLDPFLILTPVLLLAIVALLGFVGCYQNITYMPAGGDACADGGCNCVRRHQQALLLNRSRSRAAS